MKKYKVVCMTGNPEYTAMTDVYVEGDTFVVKDDGRLSIFEDGVTGGPKATFKAGTWLWICEDA